MLKILQVNLKDNRGLKELIQLIEFEIQQLDHIGDELPLAWIEIRKDLEEIAKTRDHISDEKYFEICADKGLKETEKGILLSNFFHDLGVAKPPWYVCSAKKCICETRKLFVQTKEI